MPTDELSVHTGTRVAILGPFGTYSHEAAYRYFGKEVLYEEKGTIKDVLDALSSTSADFGVVPQENTIFGSVVETYDTLRSLEEGFVRGEVILRVDHCLLVKTGVKLNEIRTVLSHEQGLGQCREFIETHLPGAATEKYPSTAAAARELLNRPPNCAAICSRVCATLFVGLEVLREAIQKDSVNYTRFYVVARDQEMDYPISTVPGERQALFRISTPQHAQDGQKPNSIGDVIHRLNLKITRIDRRPTAAQIPFHDIYFVEVQSRLLRGDSSSESLWTLELQKAVDEIESIGATIDLIGNW